MENIQPAPVTSEETSCYNRRCKALLGTIRRETREQWQENKIFVLSVPFLIGALIAYIVIHSVYKNSKTAKSAVMIIVASLMLLPLMHLVMVGAWKNLAPKAKYAYILLIVLIAAMIAFYQIFDKKIGTAFPVLISLMSLMHGLTSVLPTLLKETTGDVALRAPPYDPIWDDIYNTSDGAPRPYDQKAILLRMDYFSRSITGFAGMIMQKQAEENKIIDELQRCLDLEAGRAEFEAARANDERARANKEATRADLEAARVTKLSLKLEDQLKVIKRMKEDRRIKAVELLEKRADTGLAITENPKKTEKKVSTAQISASAKGKGKKPAYA